MRMKCTKKWGILFLAALFLCFADSRPARASELLSDGEYAVEVNSVFTIPVAAMDEDMTVIADTLAMGTPHEVEYVLHFYSDSLGAKSSLPQEGAKRVLLMAAVIIVGGGILNHWVQKRRRQDYTGKRSSR